MSLNAASQELKAVLKQKIPAMRERINVLKKQHGDVVLNPSTIGSCYGGVRGVTALIYEPSLLDAEEGIRFRGYSVPECSKLLPKWNNGTEMMPEAMLWLLLTGDVPTKDQAHGLAKELYERATNNKAIMEEMTKAINALPTDLHPMTQFAIAILALQKDSKFAHAYHTAKKADYWEYVLEDLLNCAARISVGAALIYRRSFKDGKLAPLDPNLDWTGNFVNQLGYSDAVFADAMRMYLCIHTDHEGGNVSAHATTLVGSALSDPYLSYAGGMCGLAGPLHGLANQECLGFLRDIAAKLEKVGIPLTASDAELKPAITKITWDLLNSGQVVPGYGHAVLRRTDPRYTALREFALKHIPSDNWVRLVSVIYEIMPGILTQHGKTKNPYPNVDAHSGVVLNAFGLKEENYYTVLFGLSRGLGVMSALLWDRATGKPIERPKSVTTDSLWKKLNLPK